MVTTPGTRTGTGAPLDEAACATVRQAELFRGLAPEDIDALLPSFSQVTVTAQQTLFRTGDYGDHLYVVVSGRVLLSRETPEHQHAVLAVLGPQDMCGELSLFDPGPRTSTATAATLSSAAELHRDGLLAWAAGRPEITERLLRVLARRLRRTNDTVSDLLFTDVAGRLAKTLLDLALRFGRPGPRGVVVEHGLTQVELAGVVGSARETVNKALGDFADRGWVELGQRFVVLRDVNRLAQRARVPVPDVSRLLSPQR